MTCQIMSVEWQVNSGNKKEEEEEEGLFKADAVNEEDSEREEEEEEEEGVLTSNDHQSVGTTRSTAAQSTNLLTQALRSLLTINR